MSIFETFEKAFADRDIDTIGALFHTDYEMTMHSSEKTLPKRTGSLGLVKFWPVGPWRTKKSAVFMKTIMCW